MRRGDPLRKRPRRLRAQAIHGGLIFVCVEDECMVDAVGHFGRTFVYRSRLLDEQKTHPPASKT
jgi:hypothetical protein